MRDALRLRVRSRTPHGARRGTRRGTRRRAGANRVGRDRALRPGRAALWLGLLLLAVPLGDALARPPAPDPAAGGYDPPLEQLGGREIYDRVLENRFRSYVQVSSLLSGDRAGNGQETRVQMWFQSFRDDDGSGDPSVGETLSKTLVKYTHPFDIRHSGYLIINKYEQPNDQFVYLASHRRVRRVNLRGEAVFGTDFSFEDIIPKELEDADYRRLPDDVLEGTPCFVIEARPKAYRRSEYSRLEIHVEKARSVPLQTRYWDDREIEVKRLKVDPASIERIRDVWVPHFMTMRNLRHETFTTLRVLEIDPNPELERTVFDLRRLEGH